MQVLETIEQFRRARTSLSGSLGLVPTMGYLHRGHVALLSKARDENSHVAVSIFVNPTQFGKGEDFTSYPRDLHRDLEILEHSGVELVFTPAIEEMYPTASETTINSGVLGFKLEGLSRPGHFSGVATVVAKLFHIVKPDKAYFGQKDAQQLVIINRMVKDLNFDLDVIGVPTVREPDGLAISSRNVYLNPEQRQAAVVIWRSLVAVRDCYDSGERNAEVLKKIINSTLANEPLAKLDYISLADPYTLEEIKTIDRATLVSIAVLFGRTRLIDNINLNPS